jgi:hypothetical protein
LCRLILPPGYLSRRVHFDDLAAVRALVHGMRSFGWRCRQVGEPDAARTVFRSQVADSLSYQTCSASSARTDIGITATVETGSDSPTNEKESTI